jgi:hypothetical protein
MFSKAPEGWRSPKPGGISQPDLNWPRKNAEVKPSLDSFAATFREGFCVGYRVSV